MDGIQDKELTEQIIAAAIAVHRELGPGFLESVYEEALCIELRQRGIAYDRQKRIDILFRGEQAGEHRLDLLAEGNVIVEIKAVKDFEPVFLYHPSCLSERRQAPDGTADQFQRRSPCRQTRGPRILRTFQMTFPVFMDFPVFLLNGFRLEDCEWLKAS